MAVHLTRPKSSKGRRGCSTNTFNFAQNSGENSGGGFGVGGQELRHSRRLSEEQVELNLSAAGLSLNKYSVLPSIEKTKPKPRRQREDKSPVQGCEGTELPVGQEPDSSTSEDDRKVPLSPNSLLLAIKDPVGRRFQQHFHLSDTLLHVRATAEVKYCVKFGENATIETMEVPRRSFTDMSLTLEQCSISNRSVLCIFQPQDE